MVELGQAVQLEDIRLAVEASGQITADLTLAVRRAIYADGVVDRGECQALFAIDRARRNHSVEWAALYREIVVDLALNTTQPQGYLSDEDAAWLEQSFRAQRDLRPDTELEALVAVVEKAQYVPLSFSAYVLRHIKNTVIYSDGLDAQGRDLGVGSISEGDIHLLRRCVWGAGCGQLLAIGREEAEALFDIADAVTGAKNDPQWTDFFARCVGNYLVGATGRSVPTREEALGLWNTDYKSDVLNALLKAAVGMGHFAEGGFIKSALLEGSLSESVERNIRDSENARAIASHNAMHLVGAKADWLLDRVRRNGATSDAERQLLWFLKENSVALAPELSATIDASMRELEERLPPPVETFGRRKTPPVSVPRAFSSEVETGSREENAIK